MPLATVQPKRPLPSASGPPLSAPRILAAHTDLSHLSAPPYDRPRLHAEECGDRSRPLSVTTLVECFVAPYSWPLSGLKPAAHVASPGRRHAPCIPPDQRAVEAATRRRNPRQRGSSSFSPKEHLSR